MSNTDAKAKITDAHRALFDLKTAIDALAATCARAICSSEQAPQSSLSSTNAVAPQLVSFSIDTSNEIKTDITRD